ncbi:LuxR C-terminal-related transcriptional regulator [Kitasatospora sp. NPDC048194]|uniref:LuxR C-terminal-related transcriptional regulator n=1 Tax=Kitasatospora sp. NPDC048194 TaxID=3364045 RepID=UPI00371669EB
MCRSQDSSTEMGTPQLCDTGLEFYRTALAEGGADGQAPECLLAMGLLRVLPGSDHRLAAVPPDLALTCLTRPLELAVLAQQERIAEVRTAFAAADHAYQDVMRQARLPIRLLAGEEINPALEKAVAACAEELRTAQPGGGRSADHLADALPRDLALADRGVRQRTLYQHTVRSHGPTLAYIEQVTARGAQVRTLNEVFDRMIICDRSTVFIPAGADREAAAMLIELPPLVEYLIKIYELMWDRAEPVTYLEGHHRPPLLTDRTRQNVLRLMVNGYTDEAIASRLGMSTRTVSSHIQKASELLGSRSRGHLGYIIAREGVLDAPLADCERF